MTDPQSSSQRGAPYRLISRQTTRRNRHAPHSATGAAATRSTVIVVVVPRTEATSASGRTYGGAGTALPKPIACQLS